MLSCVAFAAAAVDAPMSTIEAAPDIAQIEPTVSLFSPSEMSTGPKSARHSTPSPTALVITMLMSLATANATKTMTYGFLILAKRFVAIETKAWFAPICVI